MSFLVGLFYIVAGFSSKQGFQHNTECVMHVSVHIPISQYLSNQLAIGHLELVGITKILLLFLRAPWNHTSLLFHLSWEKHCQWSTTLADTWESTGARDFQRRNLTPPLDTRFETQVCGNPRALWASTQWHIWLALQFSPLAPRLAAASCEQPAGLVSPHCSRFSLEHKSALVNVCC